MIIKILLRKMFLFCIMILTGISLSKTTIMESPSSSDTTNVDNVNTKQMYYRIYDNTRLNLSDIDDILFHLNSERVLTNSLEENELLLDCIIERIGHIDVDMYKHIDNENLFDFMNYQFDIIRDFDGNTINALRADLADYDMEALNFFDNYLSKEIIDFANFNSIDEENIKTMSAVLTNRLIGAGLSSLNANVITGTLKIVIAAAKAFFTPTIVKVAIIGAALLVMTAVIISNWSKISPIISVITSEFVNAARSFASTITNFFNNVTVQARSNYRITYNGVNYDTEALTETLIKQLSQYSYYVTEIKSGELRIIITMVISRGAAVMIMQGNLDTSVYTFHHDNARSVAQEAGGNCSPIHENHNNKAVGKNGYLNHYHIWTHSQPHIFYGLPVWS